MRSCVTFSTQHQTTLILHLLTQLSQLPATSKFDGIVAGLNAKAEVESSGGETTSKSFIGLTVAVDEPVVNEDVPSPPCPNIFYEDSYKENLLS